MIDPGWAGIGIVVVTNLVVVSFGYGSLRKGSKDNEESIKIIFAKVESLKQHTPPCLELATLKGEISAAIVRITTIIEERLPRTDGGSFRAEGSQAREESSQNRMEKKIDSLLREKK